MSNAQTKKDLNPSPSNSPGNAKSGGKPWYQTKGAIIGWVILAAALITGLVLFILWASGVIWTGGIDTSTPDVGPQGPPPVPSATPAPSAKPGPSASPSPKPGPSPSPNPGPSSSPAPSATPRAPIPIIPEQYEEPLNCVINSDNENCYDTPSDVTSFTYDQGVDGGPAKNVDSAGYGPNAYDVVLTGLILLTGDDRGTLETEDSSTWDTRYGVTVTQDEGIDVKLNWKHLEENGNYTGTHPPTQFLGFNLGGGTVGAVLMIAAVGRVELNYILNLTVEIYPTTDVDLETGTKLTKDNQVTTRDVVLEVDEGKLTKTYEFSPFSSDYIQYYLVVYAVGSSGIEFANQYPLYMTLDDNNRPYATVNINNLTYNWDGFNIKTVTPNLYFYITDGFSDLANLPTDTSGAISSDSNCITYPYEIKVTNAAYSTVTSVSNSTKTVTPELNCVLETGVGPCYNPASSWTEPGTPSTVEEDGNKIYVYDEVRLLQNNDATVASSLTLTDDEQTYLAIGGTGPGYMTPDVQGTGVILQNTSNSALNISMYLEINPCGGDQVACDSCSSAPASGCLPADDEGDPPNINWGASSTKLYYLVAFTTNGIYANQFPLFFKNADDVGAQAYVSVSNLVLTPTSIPAPTSTPTPSPTTGDQLYFFISDSMLDLSTAYIQNTSGGPWTIEPGDAYVFAPNKVNIWKLKYAIMQ